MISSPLWYQVYSHQLSFKEFLDRFNDKQFQERDVIPIFMLSVIYNHDPYIDKLHVLRTLMTETGITERSLKYFYLYWSIGKEFSNDLILEGSNSAGKFRNINILVPPKFTPEYLYDWIGIILRYFFGISIFIPNEIHYQRSDMKALMISLKYSEKAQEDRFEFQDRSTEKMYKLAIAHNTLSELMKFFKSGVYPSVLYPYRKDSSFFRKIVTNFSPVMLNTLVPFTEEEQLIIEEEHIRLYEMGDVDFFLYYIENFIKTFGIEHSLSIKLQKYLEPSNESDRIKAQQVLKFQNPIQRRCYLPQYFPITDLQLDKFTDRIKTDGIVNALTPYILNNKKRIQEELELSGCELANYDITLTQCSIFLYSVGDLIFHAEDNKLYVFLPEELWKFEERKNPYNRRPLPDYLYVESFKNCKTENLEEIWTKILRHSINLQQIL